MSYTVEQVDARKALESIAEYQYALVYMMSGITFCKTTDLGGTDWDECLEARFFDENKELHLYDEDGGQIAVKVTGTMDNDCLMKKYELQKRYYIEKNKYLCVCEHLGYDDDGQASVVLTRLTGIA